MQLEVYKTIDDYLNKLKQKGEGSIFDMKNPRSTIGTNAIIILKKYKLIHYRSHDEWGSIVDLTLQGDDCINAGGIERYIEMVENRSKIEPIVHIGHNISGDVSQSDLSTSALNRSNALPPNTPNKQSIANSIFKWVLKNIVQIIITVIAAGIAYYLGFTKSH